MAARVEERESFVDVEGMQNFLAARAGGEPFDYARDKALTIETAEALGVGDQARKVIEASRGMDSTIEESVRRAERASVEPLRAVARVHRERAPSAPLPRVWLEHAALPHHQARLVKGLIGLRDLVMVYGEPGCGKTFLVVDIAGHIAAHLPWRGLRTKGGLVVYIAAEAGRSILRRFIAWRDRHIGDAHEGSVPLAVVTAAVNLMLPVEGEELIAQLHEMSAEAGAPLALVVFDTLSRSMPGGDENAASDVTRVVAAADRIRDELGAAVLIVHHSGKDRSKGARGHSALTAAADTVISVADHLATVEKVRDGVAGQGFPFALEVVSLGVDEDKDPVTTCVVVAAEYGDAPTTARPGVPLGKNQQLALDVLRRILATTRKNLEERGDDPQKACVETVGWREEVGKRMKCEPAAFRARWREAFTGLQQRNLVRVDGPFSILLEEP